MCFSRFLIVPIQIDAHCSNPPFPLAERASCDHPRGREHGDAGLLLACLVGCGSPSGLRLRDPQSFCFPFRRSARHSPPPARLTWPASVFAGQSHCAIESSAPFALFPAVATMHAAAAAVGGSGRCAFAARVVSSASRLAHVASPCQRVCARATTTMSSSPLRTAPHYAIAPSASASASAVSVPRRCLSTALPQVGAPLRRKVTTVDLIAMKKRKHKISSQTTQRARGDSATSRWPSTRPLLTLVPG